MANQSDLFIVYLMPGKQSRITFGKVSRTIEFFTALNLNRNMAWRLFGAFTALVHTALTKRNVFPLRLPPNSMMWVASPASNSFAASCTAVNLKGGVCIAQLQDDRPAILTRHFGSSQFGDVILNH